MKRPTDVQVAEVWREATQVGAITRTPNGSVFEYNDVFFEQHKTQVGGVATHLPYSQRQAETLGYNLHPYFAGLLPEGLRLQALVQRVKTSEDDMLSLLIASGIDTVGNLSVRPSGETFESDSLPEAPLKAEEVLFTELFEQSLSQTGEMHEPVIAGVQEKVSASTISFPLKPAGRFAYILKLNPPKKPRLIENEDFFMRMAKSCGLVTATTHLIRDRAGNPGLSVERFDRRWSKDEKRLLRIAQEDACQFLNRYPADKYRIHCSEIAKGLQDTCLAPIPEMARFLRLVAFSYLIANGDLHAKNVSVLADGPAGGFRLSPAYDVLTTLPYGDRRMALKFEGRDDNLKRSHFIEFGKRFGVKEVAVTKMLDELVESAKPWLGRLDEIGFGSQKTEHLSRTLEKRRNELAAG
ncbi:type II toxin-antitoxin system HipA family toxin [Corallococcus llansteffanensis]|uniref:Type II toxin-antitoxin system HipA family toxin n=1 Tax=Corallococcus llansteffanensis TaxID=2316731 RepID=A0A3A8P587_9BACT|nr:type II toxin-antitoxin system HipA family toxin [Corallococcus llansteffanensis]RKH51637.1 type II toxin-antitoxin system HipA family toxin [Corallococcus llansteffanensis]